MDKIPVYFVPGMATGPMIFEYINLPEDTFEVFFLEWLMPGKNERLPEYTKRMVKGIKHKNPVLIGVSLGGIVVQEMKKLIDVRKVIIISSVKSNKEFPRRMKFAKFTKIYKVFPTRMMQNVDKIRKLFKGNNVVTRRLDLYERFMSVRSRQYLDWAFREVIEWDRTEPDTTVTHIHGTDDMVFPAKYIKTKYIPVKGGTHIMIINKFSWMNYNLPKIILEE